MANRTVRVELRAEIGDYLAKLQQASAATADLAHKTAETAQTNREAWSRVGTGFTVMGAAAAAGFGLATKTAMDFDAQMSAVKATGSEAAANIGQLREAAMQAGAAFGQFSGIDAAKGIEELAKAGMEVRDILGGGLTGALSLAAAGEMEVGEAAELTAKSLSQFQLSGEQASHVADLLAAGAGKAVGSVHDMGEALKMSGLVAHQYGIDIETTTGTLALFAQNSLIGSDAGTSLKQMLLQLAAPTTEAQASLDSLGVSAYDAQGNFVGMSALAEQLKTKVGALSPELQNAALKTIFGADAIRAANILMREGGAGIDEWTKKVNDQGYASEVAATKMDNLRGDLRQLTGAWENLMISAGSAGTGPLRSITQDLTGLLDFLGRHQTTTQVLFGLATGFGALALAAGALMKTVSAVAEFSAALTALRGAEGAVGIIGRIGPALSAAGIGASAFLGPLALMAGATVLAGAELSAFDSSLNTVLMTTDQVAAAMDNLAAGTSSAVSSFDADISQMVIGSSTLAEAIQHLDSSSFGDTVTRGLSHMADAISAGSSTVSNFREELDKIDQSLVRMDSDKAASAFATLSAEMAKQGVSSVELAGHLDAYRSKLQGVAATLQEQVPGFDAAKLSAQDYADWMGGKVPAAVRSAMDAGRQLGVINRDTAASFGVESEQAAAAAKAITEHAQAALASSGSLIGLEAAIDQATETLAKNGRTLDINTAAGRANRSALDSIAASGLKVQDSLSKAGASVGEVEGAQRRTARSFIETAQAAGMSASAAVDLAGKYGLIPRDVQTQIKSLWERGQYDQAMALLKAADGKTSVTQIITEHIDIYTTRTNVALDRAAGRGMSPQLERATGGPVWGPGTATSDSIPAWLSNGEFVHQAAAVDYYGEGLMWALNHRAIPKDVFSQLGFAGGGGPSYPAPSMPAYMGSASAQGIGSGGGVTFAPQITATGPDAGQVVDAALVAMRHEARTAIPALIGA